MRKRERKRESVKMHISETGRCKRKIVKLKGRSVRKVYS